VARDNRILTDEVRRNLAVVIAIKKDFGRPAFVLAATGACFSELVRMAVGDVQASQSRLMGLQSFKAENASSSISACQSAPIRWQPSHRF